MEPQKAYDIKAFEDLGCKDFRFGFDAIKHEPSYEFMRKEYNELNYEPKDANMLFVGRFNQRPAWASSDGTDVWYFYGQEEPLTMIDYAKKEAVQYEHPFSFLAGRQKSRERSKARRFKRGAVETLIHFLFLSRVDIKEVCSRERKDALVLFKYACEHFKPAPKPEPGLLLAKFEDGERNTRGDSAGANSSRRSFNPETPLIDLQQSPADDRASRSPRPTSRASSSPVATDLNNLSASTEERFSSSEHELKELRNAKIELACENIALTEDKTALEAELAEKVACMACPIFKQRAQELHGELNDLQLRLEDTQVELDDEREKRAVADRSVECLTSANKTLGRFQDAIVAANGERLAKAERDLQEQKKRYYRKCEEALDLEIEARNCRAEARKVKTDAEKAKNALDSYKKTVQETLNGLDAAEEPPTNPFKRPRFSK